MLEMAAPAFAERSFGSCRQAVRGRTRAMQIALQASWPSRPYPLKGHAWRSGIWNTGGDPALKTLCSRVCHRAPVPSRGMPSLFYASKHQYPGIPYLLHRESGPRKLYHPDLANTGNLNKLSKWKLLIP